MIDLLLYFWIITVAFGPAYNLVGDAGVFGLLFLIIIFSKKVRIEKKAFVSMTLFGIFLGIKSFGIIGTEYISVFHSAYSVVTGCIKLAMLFLLLPTIKQEIETRARNVTNAFMFLFHVSIAISTIILFTVGRDTYRVNVSKGGMLLSPQFYILVSVFMSMLLVFKLRKSNSDRIKNLVLLGINVSYIYAANYTTQLIFLFFGIIAVFICSSDMKRRNVAISLSLTMLLILVIVNWLPDIISYLNSTIFENNNTVSIRMTEIEMLLRRENLQGTDLVGRFERINMSFDVFKRNIISGLSFSEYNTRQTGLVVGGHAEWPDDLARYGLVGIALFFIFIKNGSEKLLSMMKHGTNELDISLLIVMVAYGFANPLIRSQEYVLLFLIIESVITWNISREEKVQ